MIKRTQQHAIVGCLALLAVLTLAGCSLFTVSLDETDRGSIQRLEVGDLLVIRLMGNASTGYEWTRVAPETLDASPIKIVTESEYHPLGIEPIGAPGEFVFRYRAMQPGTVALRFEHRRPWEPDESIDSYTVTVWVR
ncbi:protease inhibitor I42 family protein [Candidatus Bipolaricaulota bacterium]|nr:protease inhibitor I42 family protein [Candidatus Bipolaricaulota bacterium]